METQSLVKATASSARNEFLSSLLWLQTFLRERGIEVRPYVTNDLPVFSRLSEEDQQTVLGRLRNWIEILTDSLAEVASESGADSRQDLLDLHIVQRKALWRILGKYDFRFPSDLFTRIPQDAIVEVYTADNTQVFRSLHFFHVCSYSLEEIYVLPWFELYQRDPSIDQQYLQLLTSAFRGEFKGIVGEDLCAHEVIEKQPGHSLTTVIQPNLLCTLENAQGQLSGYLHAFQLKSAQSVNH